MNYDDEHILVGRITRPKEGYTIVRCDRKTSLGNPFPMRNNGSVERDRVCDLFEEYFLKEVSTRDTAIQQTMIKLYKLAQSEKLLLTCWCYPARCHCDTIREFILRKLNKN